MEQAILTVARVAVGLVLLVAAAAKIMAGPRYVRELVGAYRILPGWAARPVARVLPWLEAAVGVLLVAGLFTVVVAAAGAALLTSFSLAVALALRRGLTVPCGCFGRSRPAQASWHLVGRNAVMVLALAVVSLQGG